MNLFAEYGLTPDPTDSAAPETPGAPEDTASAEPEMRPRLFAFGGKHE